MGDSFELWLQTEIERLNRVARITKAQDSFECGNVIGALSRMKSVLEMYKRFKEGGDKWKFVGPQRSNPFGLGMDDPGEE